MPGFTRPRRILKPTFFTDRWARRKARLATERGQGELSIVVKGKRYLVNAPFSPAFRDGANDLGATWKQKTSRWSFPTKQRRLLRALIVECYGVERVPEVLQDMPKQEAS